MTEKRHLYLCLSILLIVPVLGEASGLNLVHIDVMDDLCYDTIPVYAWLQTSEAQDYILTFMSSDQLNDVTYPYEILDTSTEYAVYIIAMPMSSDAHAIKDTLHVVYDDGRQWIIRAEPGDDVYLANNGCSVEVLSHDPMVLHQNLNLRTVLSDGKGLNDAARGISGDDRIFSAMQAVKTTNLYTVVARFTGVYPLVANGSYSNVLTRHTASGAQISRAITLAVNHFKSLGLDVTVQDWTSGSYSSQNVIAEKKGGGLSNEIVVVMAHMDDMPSGNLAPGADDNASGSVAVMTMADILQDYTFDRTIRFALFTGEEQGLLGSRAYADTAFAAGDNIIAGYNMDMIAWDSIGGPLLKIYTRTTSNPGYTNDLVIAQMFTNVVATYGLENDLTPVVDPSGMTASDHSRFWNKGYPAVLAIEDYPTDFCDYYHTTNDQLQYLNMAYYTAYTRASLGTVMHLAGVDDMVRYDRLEIINGDWTDDGDIGMNAFYAVHQQGAVDGGPDEYDVEWTNTLSGLYQKQLTIYSDPYGTWLRTDARATSNQSMYTAYLSVIDETGSGVSCSNQLFFSFSSTIQTDCIYSARITIDAAYTLDSNTFVCITNIREVIAHDGMVALPDLQNLTNQSVYGTVEIAPYFLNEQATNVIMSDIQMITGTNLQMSFKTQVGVTVIDHVWGATSLVDTIEWVLLDVITNQVSPNDQTFETGWGQATYTLDAVDLTNAPSHFLRLDREWQGPSY